MDPSNPTPSKADHRASNGRADSPLGGRNLYTIKTNHMKKLLIPIIAACVMFSGCATFNSWFGSNSCAFKMAFGNAIRSLEGSALAKDATKIPGALQALADNWLPKGNQYTDFIRGIIDSFVAAHPVTPEEVNKVLETLATKIQTGC
jgi:hypothetical protein